MEDNFELKLLNVHWLGGVKDMGQDLCAHGSVYIKINEEIISNSNNDWTVSAVALYLLRTLKQNYCAGDFNNFLLPCCGHFFVKEPNKPVCIMGCNKGIDWTILHEENNMVKHISKNNSTAIIAESKYKELVYKFSDDVENLYKKSIQRKPSNKYEEEGFNAFIEEWKILRNEIMIS
ncbi:MAG: hypothetical protein Ta2G_09660 [Termitinemataceae bacterium]|nr:MAG: hypothetical protein Ta2G_09660 [Termitinemataceae bacterium]